MRLGKPIDRAVGVCCGEAHTFLFVPPPLRTHTTAGMGALMKYYNDPEFLTKFGSKVGNITDVQAGAAAASAAAAAPPAAAAAAQAEPEINSLLDAAKCVRPCVHAQTHTHMYANAATATATYMEASSA